MHRLIYPLLLAALAAAILPGCKKSSNWSNKATSDGELIQAAEAYFQAQVQHAPNAAPDPNLRTTGAREPDWAKATVLKMDQKPVILVPVHYRQPFYLASNLGSARYYAIDRIAHLVLYRDSAETFYAELVTALPDSSYTGRAGSPFTGLVLVDHWDGNPIARYKADGTSIGVYRPDQEPTVASAGLIFQTCYEIVGYNYSPTDPKGGETWTEDAGCVPNYLFLGTPSSSFALTAKNYLTIGGGGGGTPPSPAADFTILNGSNPIGNITDYNKCFTNAPGNNHTYTVTICVDQPSPGTREPWGFQGSSSSASGNPVNVGHTFLVFTENYGGTNITRNIGFYPQGSVNPWYPSSQGQLDNNSTSEYNISLTIAVSQGNNTGYMYDLNGNNCTSFALRALASGNVILPATVGTWTHGSGNDPGDLGEDIRSMRLSPNMSRNTVENPHPNIGACN